MRQWHDGKKLTRQRGRTWWYLSVHAVQDETPPLMGSPLSQFSEVSPAGMSAPQPAGRTSSHCPESTHLPCAHQRKSTRPMCATSAAALAARRIRARPSCWRSRGADGEAVASVVAAFGI